jgi:hypothetical protein
VAKDEKIEDGSESGESCEGHIAPREAHTVTSKDCPQNLDHPREMHPKRIKLKKLPGGDER